jgi:hypothetical protein
MRAAGAPIRRLLAGSRLGARPLGNSSARALASTAIARE